MKEAKIVLGAAVIDDVLGLLILAVVSALATAGSISVASIAVISLKALAFLVGSVVVGLIVAPLLGKFYGVIEQVGNYLAYPLCVYKKINLIPGQAIT